MSTKPRLRAVPYSEEQRAWKKREIVELLQTTGDTITACVAAADLSLSTFYLWRSEDEAFKKALKDAYDTGTDVLEQEAIRRGLRGVEKPVFYQGKEVSRIQEYSDTLLMFVLKKRNPAFRENTPGLGVSDPIPAGAIVVSPGMIDSFSPKLLAMLRREASDYERRRIGNAGGAGDLKKEEKRAPKRRATGHAAVTKTGGVPTR